MTLIFATRHKITSGTLSSYNVNASFQLPLRWWPRFSWSPCLKKKRETKTQVKNFSLNDLQSLLFLDYGFSMVLHVILWYNAVITMALHTDPKHHGHKQTCTTDRTDPISEERLS